MLSDETAKKATAFDVHVTKLRLALATLKEEIADARKAGLPVIELAGETGLALRVTAGLDTYLR